MTYIPEEFPGEKFVQEIANLMGEDWKVGSLYGKSTLEKPSIGLSLIITRSIQKEGKLRISHKTPRVNESGQLDNTAAPITVYKKESVGQEIFQSILVSDEKTASQVCKDIQRRILGEAIRVQLLANEKMLMLRESNNRYEVTVEKIKNALGVQDLSKCLTEAMHSMKGGYGNVRVNGGGNSVEFEIHSLPVHKAEKLAKFLKSEIFNG